MAKPVAAELVQLGTTAAHINWMEGTADPSAGGGVAAPLASIYNRRGTAQAWLKTSAPDTGWTRLASGLYFNVREYGATGDGVTDDRAAIALAIADAAVLGGTVYFPQGIYLCSKDGANPYSFDIANLPNVRFLGTGRASVIRQSGAGGGTAWALFRVRNGSTNTVFQHLCFDGSGVTGPNIADHLIQIGDGVGTACTGWRIDNCDFIGMVVGSGDAINVVGATAQIVAQWWITNNRIVGAGRDCIRVRQFTQAFFITNNELTDATGIELNIVTDVTGTILNGIANENIITHSSTTAIAVQLLGSSAATPMTRVMCKKNQITGGTLEASNLFRCQVCDNNLSSGAYAAITSAVMRFYGSVAESQISGNDATREAGMGTGFVFDLADAAGVVPSRNQVLRNNFRQDLAGAAGNQIARLRSCTGTMFNNNILQALAAGASVMAALEIRSTAAAMIGILVSGNNIAATAGTFTRAIHVLVDGTDIGTDFSIAANSLLNCDVGVTYEDLGAGVFTGLISLFDNILEGTTDDWVAIGATVFLRVGGNAATFGANIWTGTGDPNSNVTARIGSLYLRRDGGAVTTLYVKESGTGNTGWVGK